MLIAVDKNINKSGKIVKNKSVNKFIQLDYKKF